jgi:hypothetical protein
MGLTINDELKGLDATTGFTPKEVKGRVVGDSDLRRQAKLPASALGLCAPLALGTNGKHFIDLKCIEVKFQFLRRNYFCSISNARSTQEHC